MSIIDRIKQALSGKVTVPQSSPAGTNVVQPTDLATAAELVRLAGREGWKLVPIGSGSKLDWTAKPSGDMLHMDMCLCSKLVEYEPNDMTVTVEAGMTLAALADLLARHQQRVTLDPPHADRATVGGVLAANDSGPIRFAYGTARDAVIGMSMIQADGTVIKSGGKVVKNVAGYDLHKLYIGSFGALGPIATVTFRLRPLPEARGSVVLEPADAAKTEQMIAGVLAGPTRPTFIELINARMAKSLDLNPRLSLIVGFEENAEATAWQCAQITSALGGKTLADADAIRLYERLREAAGSPAATSFKATMLSSDVAAFIERFSNHPIRFIARAANGIVNGLLDEPLPESAWREINAAITQSQGYLQVRGEVPPFLPRFGRQREDAFLSDGIRNTFDPHHRFAPERVT